MDLRNKNQNLSDDKETQFIPVEDVKRSSDKYDTQQLSAEEIQRRAMEERQRQQGYRSQQRPASQQPRPVQNQPYSQRPPQGYPGSAASQQRPVGGYPQQGYENQPVYGSNPNYNPNPRPQQGTQRPSQPYGGGYPQNQRQSYNPGGTPNYNPNYNPNYRPGNTGTHPRPQSSSQSRGTAPKSSKKPQTPVWQKLLKAVLAFIIVFFLLYSLVALVGILRTNITTTGERNRTEDAVSISSVENILVIGTDSRDPEQDTGRSDSMILLSINKKSKTVYMTSFLRDVYVYINDYYGYGKLNSAYSYGGPEMLMDTIEANYRVKIDDYVLVTFEACAAVIDAVGGVEVTLSDEEAQALNDILVSEVNGLMGDKRNDDLLESGGTVTLNGKQALSYSRIRYVGNADFERTSRQRQVLAQALKKACKNPVALSAIFSSALPKVTTNIPGLSLYGYTLKAPFMLIGYEIKQQQIPADGTFYNDTINGEAVLVADFTENHNELRRTIFK